MSTDFKTLTVKKYPRLPGRKTHESRYWRKFKSPIVVKEFAAVSSIHFSETNPYDFAVTASTRVQIYSSKTHQVKKTISRFKDVAYSGTIRADGRLVVAGDATGLIQIFDVGSRAILRTFRDHRHPVHVAKFSSDKTQILSASDDKTVRIWDMPSETPVTIFTGHEDYIRAGMVSHDNPHLILSGSYDQTVKLWDMRTQGCVMTMNHGAPVEAIDMFPDGGVVVAAGGPNLKVFDILAGGRPMHSLSNHQKTVTSLCFDNSYSRLLTGSLDHHVKVYNVQDYSVVHSVKYPAPVMSVALSPDDTHLVAGMAGGLLSIRQRVVKTPEVQTRRAQEEQARGGSYKYFVRGQKTAGEGDITVESQKKRRLREYDRYLKAFQYGNALDACLRTNQPAVTTVSLIQELIHRDGLKQALAGRDDNTLEPLTQFLVRNINNPRYTALLVDVSTVVIDMYSAVLGQSPLIDELFLRLRTKVKAEIAFQKQLLAVVGSMEMLFAKSTSTSASIASHNELASSAPASASTVPSPSASASASTI
ncbi:U3 small nucleolar RNA-associated protein 15 [Entomortierella parvispora]|uniref:U3 small nucleolar RNA-associated protein 15 n=1 Tax=Entomortierella parvispora TaxID=205924 RepID=A0A9P3H5L4_9FUNG|nr:U3 small nucleolar RNA-associated protein 15 [Entomortierella parvispora]